MSGRHTKLTKDVQATICEGVFEGLYAEEAAVAAGIHPSTFYRWMKRGSQETKGPFCDFCEAVKKAQAQSELDRVRRIREAGVSGNWQADAWYLERRYPQRWSRRQEPYFSADELERPLTQEEADRTVAGIAQLLRDLAGKYVDPEAEDQYMADVEKGIGELVEPEVDDRSLPQGAETF